MSDSLIPVAPFDVPKVWPLVADMVELVYARMDEETPDVQKQLLEERRILWIYEQDGRIIGCCITALEFGRLGLVCRVTACGAPDEHLEAEFWSRHIQQIEAYAKAEGCYKVAFKGRRGWVKHLPDYAPRFSIFEKRI